MKTGPPTGPARAVQQPARGRPAAVGYPRAHPDLDALGARKITQSRKRLQVSGASPGLRNFALIRGPGRYGSEPAGLTVPRSPSSPAGTRLLSPRQSRRGMGRLDPARSRGADQWFRSPAPRFRSAARNMTSRPATIRPPSPNSVPGCACCATAASRSSPNTRRTCCRRPGPASCSARGPTGWTAAATPSAGVHYQLDLSEPANQNAIHGLTRWCPLGHRAAHRAAGEPAARAARPARATRSAWSWRPATGSRPNPAWRSAVTARNVGSAAAPYGTGSHPYLTTGAASVDECDLTLPAGLRLPNGDRGIPAGPAEEVAGTGLRLPHLPAGRRRPAGPRVHRAGPRRPRPGPGPAPPGGHRGGAVDRPRLRLAAGVHRGCPGPGPPPPGGGHRADDLPAQRVRVRGRPAHAGARRQRDAHLGHRVSPPAKPARAAGR